VSDKPFDKINPLDQVVRRAARCGMTRGTVVVIEFFSGFELFNTRPYHNYETWSQGWRVHGRGAIAEREDLDDAINEWASAVNDLAEGKEIKPWNRLDNFKRDGAPFRAGAVIAGDNEEASA
jgi:hypothetical protein